MNVMARVPIDIQKLWAVVVLHSGFQACLAASHHRTGIYHHGHQVGPRDIVVCEKLDLGSLQDCCCDLNYFQLPKVLHINSLPLWVIIAHQNGKHLYK